MRNAGLRELRTSLRARGVPGVYISRLMNELEDHFEDLEDEARAAGRDSTVAYREALHRLGAPAAITAAVMDRPELQSWWQRWPWLVSLIKPVVLLLLVPAIPVLACVDRAPAIARWSASISLASVVTLLLLLSMAQSLLSAG
ncbi:MAG TPA: hypothetical protein VIV14_09585 [Gammaproteobacteria bacterium]